MIEDERKVSGRVLKFHYVQRASSSFLSQGKGGRFINFFGGHLKRSLDAAIIVAKLEALLTSIAFKMEISTRFS